VLYNLIESETKTLMLANARVEYAFTVVDPAVVPGATCQPQAHAHGRVGVFSSAWWPVCSPRGSATSSSESVLPLDTSSP
jgi:hypothetical protein